jgi:hypothetical protein
MHGDEKNDEKYYLYLTVSELQLQAEPPSSPQIVRSTGCRQNHTAVHRP